MEKQYTTVYVDPETKAEIERLAKETGRSIVGQIRWMLKQATVISNLDEMKTILDKEE